MLLVLMVAVLSLAFVRVTNAPAHAMTLVVCSVSCVIGLEIVTIIIVGVVCVPVHTACNLTSRFRFQLPFALSLLLLLVISLHFVGDDRRALV
jgi:hypothetical protein